MKLKDLRFRVAAMASMAGIAFSATLLGCDGVSANSGNPDTEDSAWYDSLGKCKNIDDSDLVSYAIFQPNGGEVYRIGDTATFKFCSEEPAQFAFGNAGYMVSPDSGENWYPIVFTTTPSGPTAKWAIPDSLTDFVNDRTVSTASIRMLFRLSAYQNNHVDHIVSQDVFTILPRL